MEIKFTQQMDSILENNGTKEVNESFHYFHEFLLISNSSFYLLKCTHQFQEFFSTKRHSSKIKIIFAEKLTFLRLKRTNSTF